MIELENYKDNLDVIDKFLVKNIKVNKAVVYTGDIDYINEQKKEIKRDSPLLASAILGLDNTAAPIPAKSKFFDIWTDIDAQEIYLDTKPTCYLIYGKVGGGAYSLGEALSKKFNCVHLCSKTILIDEIEQNSPTGRTWDFNMRHNKVCTFDMILAMLKIKLKSDVVQHRGYVISDLPLVTCSRNPLYLHSPLYGEEAFLDMDELVFETICNLKKKKPKKTPDSPHSSETSEIISPENEEEEEEEERIEDQQAEEEVAEEEVEPAELPKFMLDTCSNIVIHKKAFYETKQAVLLRQVQEIFDLFIPPDIIIHITCPDMGVVRRRMNRYINYKTGQNVVDPLITKAISETRWPSKFQISDYENPPDTHVFNPKYNCRPPLNFKDRSFEQICNYNKYVFPYVEKRLMDFDPKMVIELDGRTSVHQMMHHISERLILLHIQPVIIPEPLYLQEPPENMEEFWASVEELKVIRNGVVSFRRYASPWFNRCPVELKLRRTVIGNPTYAVMFFKHVYLMSSLNNFILFCKNPRPFLKLEYLEPTCRIIVLGTKCSGKTMISECLSWIFDTPITNFKEILETERQKKYGAFAKTILSEIIATIEDARLLEWQKTELNRVTQLNVWCNSTTKLLTQYITLLIKRLKYKEKLVKEDFQDKQKELYKEDKLKGSEVDLKDEQEELKEKEEIAIEEEKEMLDEEFLKNFNDLKKQLSFLPILDSVEECEMVLANQNVSQYAPIELTTPTNKPSIPVLGDEDVTKAVGDYIVSNDLQKEFEPTTEELMSEIVKIISTIDSKHQEETNYKQLYGKYIIDGLPSDPEYWGYLNDPKLIPDYTIALIENREIDQELYQYYTYAEKYTKHYNEKILLAKDPLIHTRLQTAKQSELKALDMEIIVNSVIDDALDFVIITKKIPEDSEAQMQDQFNESFNEAINKFREDWDTIKLKLESKSKSYIEIELENKTDVEIIDEVLLKLRQAYCFMGDLNEDEVAEVSNEDEDDEITKDLLKHNDPQFMCETNIYCPIAYYDYGILWEGKPEFTLKYENKIHNFCKEEFRDLFCNNITKYQSYNRPFKKLPRLKICVVGCLGSGASSLSKQIAKELGLLHIDFSHIINDFIMPKHFKKVGRYYENIFTDEPLDEEGVVEFQVDEENANLVSDILSNETELRRMLNNYFERGTPILSILMQKMIKKIWFDPFVSTGFVLDGYPKLPTDVEDMLACFCIPDIVIVLENTAEVTVERIAPIMFKTWKSQQNEAKKTAKLNLDNKRKEWMQIITKKIVPKLIIEEIFDNMFFSQAVFPLKDPSNESVIMDANPTGSANVDPVLFNFYNEIVQEYPEPTDTETWEKSSEARERIEARIEAIFETNDENIQTLKDLLIDQRIKMVTIDSTKPINKMFRMTLSKLTYLKHRCESFFEQTFIVNTDIAEMLLLNGFCFLSKFNRLCPVYVFENPQAILNSYKISRLKGTIFPVVHRSYIYFISSEDNVIKFRTNPLKYITSDSLKSYFEYPLRIAVIGTPDSGRSTLAAQLAKRNGLVCISRGKAVRTVLETMPWTELSIKIMKKLLQGEIIDADLTVRAIQSVAIDHRTVTYGFVYDGFPATPYEARALVKNGLYPNIIFDINSSKEKILENSQKEIYYDILKYKPPYPYPLIEKRYENWRERRFKLRSWIDEDHQNLCFIDGNNTKWQILQNVNDEIMKLTSTIHYYVCNVEKKIVRALSISNEAFEKRQSQYKNMCPVCFDSKVYRHMGFPGDKKGVVIYKNTFYWICDEHLDTVMKYPQCYLIQKKIKIPEIAAIVKTVSLDYLYENGVCIVTYAENLPAQIIKRGTNKFAASYDGRTYLFCTATCLKKFLDKPQLYGGITVFKERQMFPKLCLKNLPNIGYLEQTLGNILTEACCSVNVVRPKYPGLSFQVSALIHIALYLKTHNPLIDEAKKIRYLNVLKIFEARCKLLLNAGILLRSMDNPFATYPECHHKEPTLRPVRADDDYICSSNLQRPSNISHRISNYVQIHKASIIHPLHRASTNAGQMRR